MLPIFNVFGKYYRCGKCKHGRSGNKPDKSGNTCPFKHPQTCKIYEMYGYKHAKGCKDKKCEKLHLSICKLFMKYQNCKFGEHCRYFHPKKLKSQNSNSDQKMVHQRTQHENLTNANIVKKNLQPQIEVKESGNYFVPPSNQEYRGQSNQINQPFLDQTYHVKPPFLGQQNTQKQIMEIKNVIMGLNQKMMDLEKSTMHM